MGASQEREHKGDLVDTYSNLDIVDTETNEIPLNRLGDVVVTSPNLVSEDVECVLNTIQHAYATLQEELGKDNDIGTRELVNKYISMTPGQDYDFDKNRNRYYQNAFVRQLYFGTLDNTGESIPDIGIGGENSGE